MWGFLVAVAAAVAVGAGPARAAAPLNVLMIAIDDLRVELSPYGFAHMHTPNIQRLADRSMLFERAYVQVALCMPSRTALLVSRRPDTTYDWTISPNEWFRTCGGPKCPPHKCGGECGMQNGVTLPQFFKEQGYTTKGMGKIFHEGIDTDYQDYKYSWTDPVGPPTGIYDPGSDVHPPNHDGPPCLYAFDCEDDDLQDGKLAAHAVSTLQNLSHTPDKPFFLAVGFHKPHIPWYAPKKYWDFYPNASVNLAPNKFIPGYVPDVALQAVMAGWSSCNNGSGPLKFSDLCRDVHPALKNYPYDNSTVPDWKARQIRQAYWAASSYTDANIGRVLDALNASPFANNTVIALWGDHGYALGDNNLWAKQTNFEHATRIPFIIHYPGAAPGRTSALVEEVDLFPTLVEAAVGTPMPHCPADPQESRKTGFCTEGFSLLPLVRDNSTQFKTAAFSQYNRENENIMGYSMRQDTLRYTCWVRFDRTRGLATNYTIVAEELYSHEDHPVPIDFNVEHLNLVSYPAYNSTVTAMRRLVRECHARPDLCLALLP